ncbi:SDR family NAD(P)-dependent oxidoreductase [Haloarchaeobius sp. TZWWS8]|uniref:SDR family NAD(P)-dependent oxidoreductase n=1 Tax=Haloarchaeobius sp. TZWWS8 TaxID=3446121 RepID=UPI003EBB3E9F
MPNEYTHTPVSVRDRAAVVLGGTGGIGRQIALGFAADGADVVATGRSAEQVEEVSASLSELGASTTEVTCNVRDRDSLVSVRDAAVEAMGGVDVLVYSVGTIAGGEIGTLPEDQWERTLEIGLTGAYRAIQVFSEVIDEGSIVVISSISAQVARAQRAANCSTKAGINGLVRATAVDLGPEVRVNAIAPGFIDTSLLRGAPANDDVYTDVLTTTPAERIGTPSDLVGAAIYLSSPAAAYTTGSVLTVDGGYSITTD